MRKLIVVECKDMKVIIIFGVLRNLLNFCVNKVKKITHRKRLKAKMI